MQWLMGPLCYKRWGGGFAGRTPEGAASLTVITTCTHEPLFALGLAIKKNLWRRIESILT